jgi:PadR family transcriptional regulator PadR
MLMGLTTQLKKGSTPTLLLTLLKERPMYGYEMATQLARRSKGRLTASEGSLYPALHQLEADGYVEGYWQTTVGPRPRRYYRMTPKGRKFIQTAQSELRQFAGTLLSLVPEAAR